MPKATVTIDLPDGWELAENTPRPIKKGEWGWWPDTGEPCQFTFDSTRSWLIVRRIAEQYVNVRLRRDDAKAMVKIVRRDFEPLPTDAVIDACREALRERCGAKVCNCSPVASMRVMCSSSDTCTLARGHAGEHGV